MSWTSEEASSSVVQFGEDEFVWEIEGKGDTKEHRVLLIGLRPETRYRVRAVSSVDGAAVDGTTTFTSGSLPDHIPQAVVTRSDPNRRQPGWTLMNVQKGDGTTGGGSSAPPTAVAYDEEGIPVWYFVHGTESELGGAISVDSTDVGVLMGPTLGLRNQDPHPPIEVDWAGETVWTCDDPLCGQPDQLSHHAGKLSNGNYVVMRDAGSFVTTISQIFYEYSPDSPEPVFNIGIEDAMRVPDAAMNDWAHGNSITIDLDADVAYMNFRWLGLIKMQYSTKKMIWHLPASYGQETLGVDFGNVKFKPPKSQISDVHDPEIHEDGTILFFDNGGFDTTFPIPEGNPEGRQTRAVEYLIDERANPPTATLVWEWPGDFPVDRWYTTELYVPYWGDADRLENGNVLITAGRRGTGSTPESRLIEVDRATGEVVWEMTLPNDYGVYRSERMDPPLLKKIEN